MSEQWYRRAIGLARRADDAQTYSLSYLGRGLMEEQRGNRIRAQRLYVRAYKAAARAQLRTEAAAARHAMIAYAARAGSFTEAQSHVSAAYKLYPSDHPWGARLAVDTAALWSLQGYYGIARELYQAALVHLERKADRLQVLANLARAAGGLGDMTGFMAYWDELTPDLDAAGEHAPQLLIQLAEGARLLGYRRKALDLIEEAVTAARMRGEYSREEEAKRLLDDISEGHPGTEAQAPPLALRRFSRRFVKRLQAL